MTVCIDTNVLMSMLSHRHPWKHILEAWTQKRFEWALSNEVLTEYEELILPRVGFLRWDRFMSLLENAAQHSGYIRFTSPSYRFRVISADPDDNKFIDCAVAAEAEWIITEDAHFAPLLEAGYKPKPIRPDEFIARLLLASP